MSCSHPLLAVDLGINVEGKHTIKFLPKRVDTNYASLKSIYGDSLLMLPCGSCMSCITEHREEWAVRCELEASLYNASSFITLTYDEEHCPKKLIKRDAQLFIKKLRNRGIKCRYFLSGEYGSQSARPHFHLILFGWFPEDIKPLRTGDKPLFTSNIIDDCWKKGLCSVGQFTRETAFYVAGYVNKKLDPNMPGFLMMSTRPGIGSIWFDKMQMQKAIKYGRIIAGTGRISSLPRYFDKLLESSGYDVESLKLIRKERMNKHIQDKLLKLGVSNYEEVIEHEEFRKKDSLRRSSIRGL